MTSFGLAEKPTNVVPSLIAKRPAEANRCKWVKGRVKGRVSVSVSVSVSLSVSVSVSVSMSIILSASAQDLGMVCVKVNEC